MGAGGSTDTPATERTTGKDGDGSTGCSSATGSHLAGETQATTQLTAAPTWLGCAPSCSSTWALLAGRQEVQAQPQALGPALLVSAAVAVPAVRAPHSSSRQASSQTHQVMLRSWSGP